MAEQVQLVFDARRELVAWASHDLRTPIASIRAMLEALEDGLARPDHYLPALQEQVGTLAALVDDLFELATIDARTLSLELVDADVSQLIESCVRGLSAEAAARGVHLRADPAAARAHCAPAKVERVLYNLLTNALRHTPADGAVAVRVENEAADLTVVVEDSGDDLDGETQRRMFERFWRGEESRSTPGAGLGLAIARGIVELHGGRIWAEPRPGGGARVSFTLPTRH
jgi:signal transduction histidine kinase